MGGGNWRANLLYFNTLLLVVFYSFGIFVFVGTKSSGLRADLLTKKEVAPKRKALINRSKRDDYLVIEKVFKSRKKKVYKRPPQPLKRTQPLRRASLQVKLIIYNPDNPQKSRFWVQTGQTIEIAGVHEKIQGYYVEKIDRVVKQKKGPKEDVEYKIYLTKGGMPQVILFQTWETD